jgi:hypothetical protein
MTHVSWESQTEVVNADTRMVNLRYSLGCEVSHSVYYNQYSTQVARKRKYRCEDSTYIRSRGDRRRVLNGRGHADLKLKLACGQCVHEQVSEFGLCSRTLSERYKGRRQHILILKSKILHTTQYQMCSLLLEEFGPHKGR